MEKLIEFYKMIGEIVDDSYEEVDEDEKSPFEIMLEKQAKMSLLPPIGFDLQGMMKSLQLELPPMPEEI